MHHIKISLDTKEATKVLCKYPNEGTPPGQPVTPKETDSGRLVVLLFVLVVMEGNKDKSISLFHFGFPELLIQELMLRGNIHL